MKTNKIMSFLFFIIAFILFFIGKKLNYNLYYFLGLLSIMSAIMIMRRQT
ncbi:MAG: hypothetical protein MRZ81_03110 [Peptoniphilaceae bacterium]|nr:hypothetical protein [Peptoniphilaceae bacterium]MDD7382807.1 hypothetical protein [Peptoniphilaceae bacterium]